MNVCVFCGSATGTNPHYADSAGKLGALFAHSGISIIYGGGKIGLMGVLADAAIQAGGSVIGVIPDFLVQREVGHNGITRLEVVSSMHERKQRMAHLADAFVALPGGWGTLEELAETLTWRQLGISHQPVVVLNLFGFFDPLLEQMRKMSDEGFLNPAYRDVLKIANSPEEVLDILSRK